ncbi:hydantoin racemase [Nocardioides sp. zg-579]|uniref:Hydantoin racemase n=1 Tax=Nocardioides marmotae TaxID=2663857 RepID=A0A6I3J0J5_9ACTN|nr:aspartate/glutamate racemase family protein [Nocardioides marmotae]MCR6030085.1 hydantoin racemase [Gordonia jinghuaiqii]MTB93716.1 hydantoin racemase [Nocardioides marmotae]QKE00061.1 hydantoin racemase [Nocardioides marmotae]
MKIGVVHVNTEEASGPYSELVTGNLERAKRPDTELVHRYVRHLRRATDTAIAYPTLLNKVDVVREMVELEREGCDAVFVACSSDPGVAEARSVLTIPVVAPTEAAMGLAMGYGLKFGILTVDDLTYSSWCQHLVQQYGMHQRYAGMRKLETPTSWIFTEGFKQPDVVKADIQARARELADDGAESVIIVSAGLSTFATHTGLNRVDEPEIPIFDVLSVGLKFAEMRAELQKNLGLPPVSRAGWYGHFDERNYSRVNKLFGWMD